MRFLGAVFETNTGFGQGRSATSGVAKPFVIPDPSLSSAGDQQNSLWGEDRRSKLSPRFMERFLAATLPDDGYEYYYAGPPPEPTEAPIIDPPSFYGMYGFYGSEPIKVSHVFFTVTYESVPTEDAVFDYVEDIVVSLGITSSPEVTILSLGIDSDVDAKFTNDVSGAIAFANALKTTSAPGTTKSTTTVSTVSTTTSPAVVTVTDIRTVHTSTYPVIDVIDEDSSGMTSGEGSSSGFYGFYGSSSSFYGFYGSSSESSGMDSAYVGSSGGVYMGSSGGYVIGSSGAVVMGSSGGVVVDGSSDAAVIASSGAVIASSGTYEPSMGGVADGSSSTVLPSSAAPVGPIPSSAAPEGSMPSSAVPEGDTPSSAASIGPMPSSAVPEGDMPSSAAPAGSSSVAIGSAAAAIGSSAAAIGSSAAAIGSSGAVLDSSGAVVDSSGAFVGSSGTFMGSSGGDFYGYSVPSSPKSPSSSSTPVTPKSSPSKALPGKITTIIPEDPVDPMVVTPVYFTSVLADYNMEDLYNEQDMAQFRSDYISAIDNAIKMLGVTSNPSVKILDVLPASVAVPTVVNFVDDAAGAEIFTDVLSSNPGLAFPAFSGLGSITITDVSMAKSAPFVSADGSPVPGEFISGAVPPPETCPISRNGDTCCMPAELDAKNDCCWQGVDECGVCSGNSDTCATLATVRLFVDRPGVTASTSTSAFSDMEEDLKAGIATLFGQLNIEADHISVDTASVTSQQVDGGIEFDIPFRIDPDTASDVIAPKLTTAKAILTAAAMEKAEADGMTLIGVLNVARGGVCGNSECEIGEFIGHTSYVDSMACASDCPGFKACPTFNGEMCAGNGGCNSDEGVCKCAPGYTGADCSKCADGFSLNVAGKCVTFGGLNAPGGVPAAPAAPGTRAVSPSNLAEAEEEGGSDKSVILGAVFGVIAVVLIGLGCYYVFVIRKRNEANRDGGLGFICEEQPVASREEPDIPTRQLTESTV